MLKEWCHALWEQRRRSRVNGARKSSAVPPMLSSRCGTIWMIRGRSAVIGAPPPYLTVASSRLSRYREASVVDIRPRVHPWGRFSLRRTSDHGTKNIRRASNGRAGKSVRYPPCVGFYLFCHLWSLALLSRSLKRPILSRLFLRGSGSAHQAIRSLPPCRLSSLRRLHRRGRPQPRSSFTAMGAASGRRATRYTSISATPSRPTSHSRRRHQPISL